MWQALAIALGALAAGCGAVAIVLGSDHYGDRVLWAVYLPLLGWSFVGTGLYAWHRRPESRTGLLMVLVGMAWLLKGLRAADSSLVYTLAMPLAGLYAAVFIQLLLSFPSGRLEGRAQRLVVRAGYLILTLVVVRLLRVTPSGDERLGCEGECPRNLLLIEPNVALGDAYIAFATVVGVILLGAVAVLLLGRWRRASAPERRTLAPVLVCGGLATACFAIASVSGVSAFTWIGFSFVAALPFAFLAGLLHARLARVAIGSLVAELDARPAPGDVRDALARALRDPSLVLAYWVSEHDAYMDVEGHPPSSSSRATAAP